MKKTCYLHIQQPSIAHNLLVVPFLWMSLETYYQQVSPHADKWEWILPDVSLEVSLDDILERLSQYETLDVVGISHYVWDDADEVKRLQTWVRERHPNCIIVLGGPHQDITYNMNFFKQNPCLDLSCDPSGYGEVFWTCLLDQLVTDSYDPSQIPFAIYPGIAKLAQRSFNQPNRREITWAIKPYHRHEALIDRAIALAKEKRYMLAVTIEFSRGCPYSCTFCEWGGTGTKVVFKPMDMVQDDLSFVVAKKFDLLYVMDANFGIVKRDVEIIERLGLMIKEHQHTPHITFLGYAKNEKKYVNQILELSAELGLIDELNVSIQSLNQDTLNAVKRVDAPWRQQVQDVLKIKEKHPHFKLRLQNITGLPLSTIQDTYDLFDIAHQHDASLCTFDWHLLPSTPANAPEYLKRYAIRSVEAKVLKTTGEGCIKPDEIMPRSVVTMPVVIETSTMSFEDFLEITIVSAFVNAVQENRKLRLTFNKLQEMTQQPISQLYKSYVTNVLRNPQTATHIWYSAMENQIRAACNGEDGFINIYQLPTGRPGYFNKQYYWSEMFYAFPQWIMEFQTWLREVATQATNNN